jgi:nitrogen fixation protein FixH
MELNPYPPSVGEGEFDVTLTDLSGQAIDDAAINLDLTMPAMRMPPNQPAMEFVADGKYHTKAYYTMRGWWRIEVIITRGNETQSVFFDLGL